MKTMTQEAVDHVLGEAPEIHAEVRSIAAEACEYLGYTGLKVKISPRDYPLLRALKELSIIPLDPKAVQSYKRRQSRIEEWKMTAGSGGAWIAASFGVLLGIAVFGGLLGECLGDAWNLGWMRFATMAPVGVVLGVAAGMAVFKLIDEIEFEWHHLALSRYELPVPEFVLRKGIDISKKMNGQVKFYVEFIRQVPLADPFLVASTGNEWYHIEVWDEPKFEAKL